jgi:predicted transposase YbfD/YdcC
MARKVSLYQCFAQLHDPRREHRRLHNLWDIIALTICGVIGGADSWVEVEQYGHDKEDFLRQFLELPNGIPSHDTFGRVFALMDPAAFRDGFLRWVQALVEATEGRVVAIDGKTLRRSFDPANGKGPLHLVSAWACENRLLLGQQAVDEKSNEITAIPELLRLLDLSGAIVTIDAMGCQKAIAARIDEAKGKYVLALKENQETLYRDVCQWFIDALEEDFVGRPYRSCQTQAERKEHGRLEVRRYYQAPIPEELAGRCEEWQGLRTIGMVYSERQVGAAEMTFETRFFLSSLPLSVKRFANAVRSHWGIENNLHWVLDVSFREDESRLRKDHGPENLGLIRRVAASLLQRDETCKGGVACKRKHAGWDEDYLLEVLSNSLT